MVLWCVRQQGQSSNETTANLKQFVLLKNISHYQHTSPTLTTHAQEALAEKHKKHCLHDNQSNISGREVNPLKITLSISGIYLSKCTSVYNPTLVHIWKVIDNNHVVVLGPEISFHRQVFTN